MCSAQEAFEKLKQSKIVCATQFVKIEIINSVEILTLKLITEPQNILIQKHLNCDLVAAHLTGDTISFNNYMYANFFKVD